MNKFSVKSTIHDYEVEFVDDTRTVLEAILKEGDWIVIDNNVKRLYAEQLEVVCSMRGIFHIGIDATEAQKSYQGIEPVINELIRGGFRKNHRLVAIGGGITQDVTAFISSVMYRGVDWLFFPTTLLAQCDSCIGSKTSINFGVYKNQLGGFYPPSKIFINPRFMDTLTESEMKSGMGEMLHYFVVSGFEDFKFFKDNFKAAFKDKKVLASLVERSLQIKKGYVERDEFDRGPRQVFNYGHSFGHAIESLTHYRIPHGIAVSYGMDMANFVSMKMGLVSRDVRDEIRGIVANLWSGYDIGGIDVDAYMEALTKDKKNVGKRLGLILSKGYGKIFKNITENDKTFKDWIREYFVNELAY